MRKLLRILWLGVIAMALRDDLVDGWPFDEGAGAVAHGILDHVDLVLLRGSPSGSQPLDPLLGWNFEPLGRDTYNGGGLANVAGDNLLAASGDKVTIALRFWPSFGATGDSIGTPTSAMRLIAGMGGYYTPGDTDPASGVQYFDLNVDDAEPVYGESVDLEYIDQPASWTYAKGVAPYKPCLLIFRLSRVGSDVTVEFSADGVIKPDTSVIGMAQLDTTRVTFGGIWFSRGSVTQAALWKRRITDGEVIAFGDNLDPLFVEETVTDSPLLGADGKSAINFTWPVRRTFVDGVISSVGGPGRVETRATNERTPRRYELPTSKLGATQADLVRQAIAVSGDGLLPIAWRHPVDDPAPPAPPVMYRIVNVAEVAMDLARTRGGQRLTANLILEEVL